MTAASIYMGQVLLGVFLALIIVLLSYKAKFLNFSGSVATFILAVLIFGFGGWKWSVPILVFFIISSLLSKAGKKRKEKFKNTFEKSGVRDYAQVVANGGLAGLFIFLHILYPDPLYYHLYLVSLAAANADTWATEIGVLFKTTPRMITTFKKVEPGISGAISFYGTTASFLGSLIIALSGYFFSISFGSFILISIAGFFGSVIDSILGASFQGQYQCTVCTSYTEKKMHCDSPTNRIKGFRWLNNDLVNILSALFSILLFILLS